MVHGVTKANKGTLFRLFRLFVVTVRSDLYVEVLAQRSAVTILRPPQTMTSTGRPPVCFASVRAGPSSEAAQSCANAILGLIPTEQVAYARPGHASRAGLPQCPKDFVG